MSNYINPINHVTLVTPLRLQVINRKKANDTAFEKTIEKAKREWEWVWENPNFTPAQVLAELGADAAKAFATHAKYVQMILEVAAINNYPNPLEAKYKATGLPCTFNEDGSVTITES
jgi:hypothetical protein